MICGRCRGSGQYKTPDGDDANCSCGEVEVVKEIFVRSSRPLAEPDGGPLRMSNFEHETIVLLCMSDGSTRWRESN